MKIQLRLNFNYIHNTSTGSIFYLFVLCIFLFLNACATTPELPERPPKYVYQEEKITRPTANSLWVERASLYEDTRARRLNDLVTIRVVETIAGSGKADTTLGRTSEIDAGVGTIFGIPNDLNFKNLFGRGNTFSPSVKGKSESEFEGSGATNREGRLIGTITAKVVEVMPNGNLVIESRKEITINHEKQILVLRGMIRTEDVAVDNTVLSNKVANAEIFFVGDGIIQEKQSPGWLARFIDRVWPF